MTLHLKEPHNYNPIHNKNQKCIPNYTVGVDGNDKSFLIHLRGHREDNLEITELACFSET